SPTGSPCWCSASSVWCSSWLWCGSSNTCESRSRGVFGWPGRRTRPGRRTCMSRFICPGCRKTLSSPEGTEGQTVSCPQCGMRLVVPGAPSGSIRPERGSSERMQERPTAGVEELEEVEDESRGLSGRGSSGGRRNARPRYEDEDDRPRRRRREEDEE